MFSQVQLQTQTVGSTQTRLLDAAKHIYHQSGVVCIYYRNVIQSGTSLVWYINI